MAYMFRALAPRSRLTAAWRNGRRNQSQNSHSTVCWREPARPPRGAVVERGRLALGSGLAAGGWPGCSPWRLGMRTQSNLGSPPRARLLRRSTTAGWACQSSHLCAGRDGRGVLAGRRRERVCGGGEGAGSVDEALRALAEAKRRAGCLARVASFSAPLRRCVVTWV